MKKIISLLFMTLLLIFQAGTLYAAVDLKVTANPDPVLPNGRIEYALTVTNTGSTAVTNVVVQDLFSGDVSVNWTYIPDGGTCPGSSCQTGERITWMLGTLAAHTSRTVRYEATVKSATVAGTVVSNQTELSSDSGNATVLTSVDVVAAPGLELAITDDRDPVVSGETLTYTLKFGNRSTNVLGVTLRAPLPAGTTFVSASPGGSVVSGAVEWDLSTVLADSVGERRFTVRVDEGQVAGDAVVAQAQLLNSNTSQTLVHAEDATALAAATPVELRVTVNPDPVLRNERVEYALTVTNTGALPVTGVVVKDLFPEFVNVNWTLIPDEGACVGSSCQTGERITWDLGTLAAHSSRTVRFEATVQNGADTGAVLENLVTLISDAGEASARTAVVVGAGPELELAITDDRDPVVPGETLTYTLKFGNRSTNVLGVTLRAPLPAGTTFVSASPGGSVVNDAVEWNLSTVLADAVGERRFTVRVDEAAVVGDAVVAQAQLLNSNTSQTLVRAEDVTALAVATPVELRVTVNPDPVLRNERVEYALTVTNTGALPVTGIVVKDLFPEFVNVNWTLIPDGGTCVGSSCQTGERITWNLDTLAAHSSRTVRFEATVQNGADTGAVLENLATLTSDAGAASARTAVVVGAGPGLELAITDDRDPVVPGETLTYTLKFGNRSTNVLGVTLRAPLPAGTSLLSASPDYTVVNGAVEWNLGTVLADAVGERHFTVLVDEEAVVGDAVVAQAQLVNSNTSQTLVRAEDVTALAAATPVELRVTVNPDPVLRNERVEYALTVTNTGALPVTGVVVKDLFPESISVNGYVLPDGGVCPGTTCQAGERITWTLGTLAAHSSRTVRFEGTVVNGADTGAVLENLATLVSDAGEASARTAVVVGAGPELELAITDDRDPVVPGETLTYTLKFGNRSTNVLGVTLRAPLPAGTTFVSASPGGSVDSGAVEWDLGSVLAGAVGERHFTVRVDNAAAAGDAVVAQAQLVNSNTSRTLVRAEDVTALAAATPVELRVTVNPDPVLRNERVEYALTVTNTGALPVTGVVVKDLFPESMSVNGYVLPDGGVCPGTTCQAGERITWTLGTLAARSSRTVRFEATVVNGAETGAVLENLATLTSDVGEASARTAVVVGADSGLELSITDDRDPVVPGQLLTYTVKFGNRAATTANNLVLEAPLPVGTSFVSATAVGKLVNGVVTWNLGDRLISGGVDIRHFTVRVNANAAAGSAVHAGVRLVDATTSQSLVRAETVTELLAATPAVRLVSAVSSDQVIQGAYNYTLTVSNTTALPVTGVVVHDLFPQFVNVNYTLIQDGGTCPGTSCQTGERISWTVGTLAANSSQTLRYQATLGSSLEDGTVLRNLASVVYDVGYGSSDLDLGIGTVIDSDEDGLPDSWELLNFGNLNSSTAGDSDNDGLSNLDEYWLGTSPVDSDTDNDDMPDGFEVDNGLNPLSAADASQDADGDGLNNLNEYWLNTSPIDADTDNDGMPDGFEVNNGLDPLNAADAKQDADGDGFSNVAEYRAGSDPFDPDSKPTRAMPWLPLLLE